MLRMRGLPSYVYQRGHRRVWEACLFSNMSVVELLRRAARTASPAGQMADWSILKSIATASLAEEAAVNVNQMLLDQFLAGLGFRRNSALYGPRSCSVDDVQLLVLTRRYSKEDRPALLVYGEFRQVRLSAAFLGHEIAFVRRAQVCVAAFRSLQEHTLFGTSIHALPGCRR